MRVHFVKIVMGVLCILAADSVFATTRNVPATYATIQAAINAAASGDDVIVSPGTYTENLLIGGKNLHLSSTSATSATVRDATVIDGNSTGSVITLGGTESAACIIEGFKLTHGRALTGAGIYAAGAGATIRYCNIIGNNAVGDSAAGGGIAEAAGIVSDCIISSNTASSRGGGATFCMGTIRDCTCTLNSIFPGGFGSQNIGGGIDDCQIVRSCLISGNTALFGGGVSFCGNLIDCLVTGNNASDGGGVYEIFDYIAGNTIANNDAPFASGFYCTNNDPFVANNIIWGNTPSVNPQIEGSITPFYCCIQGWSGGGFANIVADPLFVNSGAGDFHLQAGSPCINAGLLWCEYKSPFHALDRKCRLAGVTMDIGVDEFGAAPDTDGDLLPDTSESLLSCNPANADTDGDGLEDGIEVLRGTNPAIANAPSGLSISPGANAAQRGIFLSFPGETVTLAPGTYTENLFTCDKNMILAGSNPTNDATVAATILDGASRWTVVYHAPLLNPYFNISGLTITHGSAQLGGGLRTYGSFNLNRCVIKNNVASMAGGGGQLYNSLLTNCTITQNSCTGTGAGGIEAGSASLDSCIISNNVTTGNGGGAAGTFALNSIFTGNTAVNGGATYNCMLIGSVVYGNNASSAGGGATNLNLGLDSIFWGNSAPSGAQITTGASVTYCCVQNGYTGTGNISANPMFIDEFAGNFRIRTTSPCVDAGGSSVYTFTTDILGQSRPLKVLSGSHGDNTGFDMGAYELRQGPSTSADDWSFYN